MSTTYSLEDSTRFEAGYTHTFTQAANWKIESNPDPSQTPLEPFLATCLQRVGRWSVPPNWSACEWRNEAAQVAALAGVEALHEYEAACGRPVDYFVIQRMTSRVRTRHRREWAYALRFASIDTCSRFMPQCGEAGSDDSDWIVATTEPNLDWREVREAIQGLPTAYQEVLIALYWNGYTEAEVGAMLHLSQCAINKRKQVGLQALRESLHSAA